MESRQSAGSGTLAAPPIPVSWVGGDLMQWVMGDPKVCCLGGLECGLGVSGSYSQFMVGHDAAAAEKWPQTLSPGTTLKGWLAQQPVGFGSGMAQELVIWHH